MKGARRGSVLREGAEADISANGGEEDSSDKALAIGGDLLK